MDANQIISLLPEELLADLAIETKVNRYAKKLQAEILFKLLIHCILSHKENSLRTMESAYESMAFQLLNSGKKKNSIRYNSISERLSVMNADYFEKIYQCCIRIYGKVMEEETASFIRYDSTIVALSAQLLKEGYHIKGGDAEQVRLLKFTVGFSQLPQSADLYTTEQHGSENKALKESILLHQPVRTNAIRIFDRGLNSRKTFDAFIEKKIPFVTRLMASNKHKVHIENQLLHPVKTDSLKIYSDSWVYLFSEGSKKANHPVRYIKCKQLTTKEELVFVTNIADLPPEQITDLYKRRWDIEVFFKFLKQQLNFSHLINRSENGIRIMLYSTLIAAVLLLVYKKKNGLSGYKIMKQKFVQDLEKSITRTIVIMTGGDPIIFDNLFTKPPD